jgi:hypothetical protein
MVYHPVRFVQYKRTRIYNKTVLCHVFDFTGTQARMAFTVWLFLCRAECRITQIKKIGSVENLFQETITPLAPALPL